MTKLEKLYSITLNTYIIKTSFVLLSRTRSIAIFEPSSSLAPSYRLATVLLSASYSYHIRTIYLRLRSAYATPTLRYSYDSRISEV